MKSSRLKPHQTAILYATVLAVAIWVVPGLRLALLPLVYLNTHIHELCHAMMAQLTGGQAMEIIFHADGSGVTPIAGSWILLSASAGYVGASLVGMFIMFGSRTEVAARTTLRILAIALAFAMVIWVRGDGVGILSGIFWVATLFALSKYLKGPNMMFAAQFIGIMQCVNAFDSLGTLLRISTATEVHSDASIMESTTHIPALIWAGAWCLFSAVTVAMGLRRAWSDPIRRRASLPRG